METDFLLIKVFKQHLLPVLSAILLILLGLGASLIAITYRIGSFTSMGPGFIPLVRERPVKADLPALAWRPFLVVIAGIVAWVILIETAGFFIASSAQVLLCSLALPDPKWRSMLIFTLALTIVGYLIFVLQLGVPINAFG